MGSLTFEDLPDLAPGSFPLLIALLVVGWVSARIWILRRRQARAAERGTTVETWAWLTALASSRWIMPVLGVLALLLAIAVVVTFLVAPTTAT